MIVFIYCKSFFIFPLFLTVVFILKYHFATGQWKQESTAIWCLCHLTGDLSPSGPFCLVYAPELLTNTKPSSVGVTFL